MGSSANEEGKRVVRRASTQREQVLEAVRQGQHPSAREIFEAVSSTSPMSFGTVYRNLGILEEEGVIAAIQSDPTKLRYDRRREPHHHLHCRKCGRVFDMPLPYRADFNREAAEQSGFVVESHTIAFEGLCPQCAAATQP